MDIRWGDRVLLVAPHPDDETLAAGGMLLRAATARAARRVVFVTDGENNPWAQRATELRWRIGCEERERWGFRRRGEAMAALLALGVEPAHVEFLGLPDQGITPLLLAGDDQIVESLASEIGRFHPTVLVSPSPLDLHPDHSGLAVLLRLALDRMDPRLPRPRHHQYVVHDGGSLEAVAETVVTLTPREIERKRAAILCHASQLTLRRGGLLSFAGPEERFFRERPPAENASDHPVARAFIEDDALHLDVLRHARPGAFGRSELQLLLERPGEISVLVAQLPHRGGTLELTDRAGQRLVARGLFRRTPRGERATLPASVVAGYRHVFVKLERRFGFFDEAGWRAIPARTDGALVGQPAEVTPALEAASLTRT